MPGPPVPVFSRDKDGKVPDQFFRMIAAALVHQKRIIDAQDKKINRLSNQVSSLYDRRSNR